MIPKTDHMPQVPAQPRAARAGDFNVFDAERLCAI